MVGIIKKEAMQMFEEDIIPSIVRRHGYERVAIRVAWNEYVDQLVRSRWLTYPQADLWKNPYDLPRETLERSIKARVKARNARNR
jgi:hypothetical protein